MESIRVSEANSSALPEEASTGKVRETSVCSPDSESAAILQHSGTTPLQITRFQFKVLVLDKHVAEVEGLHMQTTQQGR